MSANSLNLDHYEINSSEMAVVRDPGNAGTISSNNLALVRCEIVSAGAETRTLEAATKLPNYTRVILVLKTDGGDVTVTAGSNTIVLSAAGQTVELIVVPTAAGKVWALLANSANALVNFAAAPIALGTVSVSITDADTQAAFLALINGLKAAGIVSGTFT